MTSVRQSYVAAAIMTGVAVAGCSSVAGDDSSANRVPELGPTGVDPLDEPGGQSCSEYPADGPKVDDFTNGFSVDTDAWPIPKSTFSIKGSFNTLFSTEKPVQPQPCTTKKGVVVTGGFNVTVFSNGRGVLLNGGGGATQTASPVCNNPPTFVSAASTPSRESAVTVA